MLYQEGAISNEIICASAIRKSILFTNDELPTFRHHVIPIVIYAIGFAGVIGCSLIKTLLGVGDEITVQHHMRCINGNGAGILALDIASFQASSRIAPVGNPLCINSPFQMLFIENVGNAVIDAIGRCLRYIDDLAVGKQLGGIDIAVLVLD